MTSQYAPTTNAFVRDVPQANQAIRSRSVTAAPRPSATWPMDGRRA